MAKASGKTGTCLINSAATKVSQWTAEGSSNWVDTTDTGSGGFAESVPGIRSATVNFDVFYDLATPPTIADGAVITDVTLGNTVGSTAVVAFSAASVGVDSVSISNDVQGALTYSISAHTIGQYQFGAIPS